MNASSLSDRFRARRDVKLRELIATLPRGGEVLRVLDLGGRASYWRRVGFDFLRQQKVRVDILNVSIEEQHTLEEGKDLFSYVLGDARALEFADDSYDLCHANSVIEHVGFAWDMERFAHEARRVAPAIFIQTPNFWFPIDPHFWKLPFIHWLPRPLRARLMLWLPLATAGCAPDLAAAYRFADSSLMLSKAQMRYLFPDARLVAERVLGTFAKSYTAIRLRR
jgi:hypothetical protein